MERSDTVAPESESGIGSRFPSDEDPIILDRAVETTDFTDATDEERHAIAALFTREVRSPLNMKGAGALVSVQSV